MTWRFATARRRAWSGGSARHAGHALFISAEAVRLLEPDVARVFPNSRSVNHRVLRLIAEIARKSLGK